MKIMRKIARRLRGGAPADLKFDRSGSYWEERYRVGGDSGAGSYGRLAKFKARVLNDLVARHDIRSVIEFGCGDGNQLRLARYPSYVGIDVSETALQQCRKRFGSDGSKRFLREPPAGELFDLSMSLDVIYHLVEDEVFDAYMTQLFASAKTWVAIYASNTTPAEFSARFGEAGNKHVRHRLFTAWIEENQPDWKLVEEVPNEYPYDPCDPNDTSFANFYLFRK
jgi:SAM-dependent methyltransferase